MNRDFLLENKELFHNICLSWTNRGSYVKFGSILSEIRPVTPRKGDIVDQTIIQFIRVAMRFFEMFMNRNWGNIRWTSNGPTGRVMTPSLQDRTNLEEVYGHFLANLVILMQSVTSQMLYVTYNFSDIQSSFSIAEAALLTYNIGDGNQLEHALMKHITFMEQHDSFSRILPWRDAVVFFQDRSSKLEDLARIVLAVFQPLSRNRKFMERLQFHIQGKNINPADQKDDFEDRFRNMEDLGNYMPKLSYLITVLKRLRGIQLMDVMGGSMEALLAPEGDQILLLPPFILEMLSRADSKNRSLLQLLDVSKGQQPVEGIDVVRDEMKESIYGAILAEMETQMNNGTFRAPVYPRYEVKTEEEKRISDEARRTYAYNRIGLNAETNIYSIKKEDISMYKDIFPTGYIRYNQAVYWPALIHYTISVLYELLFHSMSIDTNVLGKALVDNVNIGGDRELCAQALNGMMLKILDSRLIVPRFRYATCFSFESLGKNKDGSVKRLKEIADKLWGKEKARGPVVEMPLGDMMDEKHNAIIFDGDTWKDIFHNVLLRVEDFLSSENMDVTEQDAREIEEGILLLQGSQDPQNIDCVKLLHSFYRIIAHARFNRETHGYGEVANDLDFIYRRIRKLPCVPQEYQAKTESIYYNILRMLLSVYGNSKYQFAVDEMVKRYGYTSNGLDFSSGSIFENTLNRLGQTTVERLEIQAEEVKETQKTLAQKMNNLQRTVTQQETLDDPITENIRRARREQDAERISELEDEVKSRDLSLARQKDEVTFLQNELQAQVEELKEAKKDLDVMEAQLHEEPELSVESGPSENVLAKDIPEFLKILFTNVSNGTYEFDDLQARMEDSKAPQVCVQAITQLVRVYQNVSMEQKEIVLTPMVVKDFQEALELLKSRCGVGQGMIKTTEILFANNVFRPLLWVDFLNVNLTRNDEVNRWKQMMNEFLRFPWKPFTREVERVKRTYQTALWIEWADTYDMKKIAVANQVMIDDSLKQIEKYSIFPSMKLRVLNYLKTFLEYKLEGSRRVEKSSTVYNVFQIIRAMITVLQTQDAQTTRFLFKSLGTEDDIERRKREYANLPYRIREANKCHEPLNQIMVNVVMTRLDMDKFMAAGEYYSIEALGDALGLAIEVWNNYNLIEGQLKSNCMSKDYLVTHGAPKLFETLRREVKKAIVYMYKSAWAMYGWDEVNQDDWSKIEYFKQLVNSVPDIYELEPLKNHIIKLTGVAWNDEMHWEPMYIKRMHIPNLRIFNQAQQDLGYPVWKAVIKARYQMGKQTVRNQGQRVLQLGRNAKEKIGSFFGSLKNKVQQKRTMDDLMDEKHVDDTSSQGDQSSSDEEFFDMTEYTRPSPQMDKPVLQDDWGSGDAQDKNVSKAPKPVEDTKPEPWNTSKRYWIESNIVNPLRRFGDYIKNRKKPQSKPTLDLYGDTFDATGQVNMSATLRTRETLMREIERCAQVDSSRCEDLKKQLVTLNTQIARLQIVRGFMIYLHNGSSQEVFVNGNDSLGNWVIPFPTMKTFNPSDINALEPIGNFQQFDQRMAPVDVLQSDEVENSNFWQQIPEFMPDDYNNGTPWARLYLFVYHVLLKHHCVKEDVSHMKHEMTWFLMMWMYDSQMMNPAAWKMIETYMAGGFIGRPIEDQDELSLKILNTFVFKLRILVHMLDLRGIFTPWLLHSVDFKRRRPNGISVHPLTPEVEKLASTTMLKQYRGQTFVRLSPTFSNHIEFVTLLTNENAFEIYTVGIDQFAPGISILEPLSLMDSMLPEDRVLALRPFNIRWYTMETMCNGNNWGNQVFPDGYVSTFINSMKANAIQATEDSKNTNEAKVLRELAARRHDLYYGIWKMACKDTQLQIRGLSAYGDLTCQSSENWMVSDLPVSKISPTMYLLMNIVNREFYDQSRWSVRKNKILRDAHLIHLVRWIGKDDVLSFANKEELAYWRNMYNLPNFRPGRANRYLRLLIDYVLNSPDVYPFAHGDMRGNAKFPESAMVTLSTTYPQELLLRTTKKRVKAAWSVQSPYVNETFSNLNVTAEDFVGQYASESDDTDYGAYIGMFAMAGTTVWNLYKWRRAHNTRLNELRQQAIEDPAPAPEPFNDRDEKLDDDDEEKEEEEKEEEEEKKSIPRGVQRNQVRQIAQSYGGTELLARSSRDGNRINLRNFRNMVSSFGRVTPETIEVAMRLFTFENRGGLVWVRDGNFYRGEANMLGLVPRKDVMLSVHFDQLFDQVIKGRGQEIQQRWRAMVHSTLNVNGTGGQTSQGVLCGPNAPVRLMSYNSSSTVCEPTFMWILQQPLLNQIGIESELPNTSPELYMFIVEYVMKYLKNKGIFLNLNSMGDMIRLTYFVNWIPAECIQEITSAILQDRKNWVPKWLKMCPNARLIESLLQSKDTPWFHDFINTYKSASLACLYPDKFCVTSFSTSRPGNIEMVYYDVKKAGVAVHMFDTKKHLGMFFENQVIPPEFGALLSSWIFLKRVPLLQDFHSTSTNTAKQRDLYVERLEQVINQMEVNDQDPKFAMVFRYLMDLEGLTMDDFKDMQAAYAGGQEPTGFKILDNLVNFISNTRQYMTVRNVAVGVGLGAAAGVTLSALGALGAVGSLGSEVFIAGPAGIELVTQGTYFTQGIFNMGLINSVIGSMSIGGVLGGVADTAAVGASSAFKKLSDTGASTIGYMSLLSNTFKSGVVDKDMLKSYKNLLSKLEEQGVQRDNEIAAGVRSYIEYYDTMIKADKTARTNLMQTLLRTIVNRHIAPIIRRQYMMVNPRNRPDIINLSKRFELSSNVYDKNLHQSLGFEEARSPQNVRLIAIRDKLIDDIMKNPRPPLSDERLMLRYTKFMSGSTSVDFEQALRMFNDQNYAKQIVLNKMKANIPLSGPEAQFARNTNLTLDTDRNEIFTSDLKEIRAEELKETVEDEREDIQCRSDFQNPGFTLDLDGNLIYKCWNKSDPWIARKTVDPEKIREVIKGTSEMLTILRSRVGTHWPKTNDNAVYLWKWLGVNCLGFENAQQLIVNQIFKRNNPKDHKDPGISGYQSCQKRLVFLYRAMDSALLFPFVPNENEARNIARRIPFRVCCFLSWSKSGEIIMIRYLGRQYEIKRVQTEDLIDYGIQGFPPSLLRLHVFKAFNGGLCAVNSILFRQLMRSTKRYDPRIHMQLYALADALSQKEGQELIQAFFAKQMPRFQKLRVKSMEAQLTGLTLDDAGLLKEIFTWELQKNVSPKMQYERLTRLAPNMISQRSNEDADVFVLAVLAQKPQFIGKLRDILRRKDPRLPPTLVNQMTSREIYMRLTGQDLTVDQEPVTIFQLQNNPVFKDAIKNNDQVELNKLFREHLGVTYQQVEKWTEEAGDKAEDFKQSGKAFQVDTSSLDTLRQNLMVRCNVNDNGNLCAQKVHMVLQKIRTGFCQPRVRLFNNERDMLMMWQEALSVMNAYAATRVRGPMLPRENLMRSTYTKVCNDLKNFFVKYNHCDVLYNSLQGDNFNRLYFGNMWKRKGNWYDAWRKFAMGEKSQKDVYKMMAMVLFHIASQTGVISDKAPSMIQQALPRELRNDGNVIGLPDYSNV